METSIGIFVVLGLICVGYLTVQLGEVSFIGDNTYSLNARFTTVTGLKAGNAVEMHGIEIGRVGSMTLDQDDQMAVVELKVRKGVQVFDDAIASIKTQGLIGDRFIEVDPGGAGEPLKPGGTITDTESPIDLGEAIGKYAFGDVEEEKK
jgi:phospholipid/cholesterol/gamma-HCH transport system substrate-binding protein